MRVSASGLRRIGTTILVALLVVIASAVPLSKPAAAGWTPNACDSVAKYYCYSVYYVPISGGVQIQTRWMAGARDGGYNYWTRKVVQDWRFDYSFFYFLGEWRGGASIHYNTGYPMETEVTTSWRSVMDEAIVRTQYVGESNAPGNPVQCEPYIDWHMYNSGHYWQLGTYGCL